MENKKIKILAIDDNKDNLITLKALIHDAFPEITVFTSNSGQEGLKIVAAEEPDIILLDIVMPGMDGFEICKKLKADTLTSDIPVVFITAIIGEKEGRIHALECGAEAFLLKPIDESEITAQIRAMLKIRAANIDRRNEKERLAALVGEKTSELEKSHKNILNLYAALKQSEEMFRVIFEQAPTGIAVVDSVTANIIRANQSFADITGRTIDELAEIDWISITHPDDLEEDLLNMALLNSGKIKGFNMSKRYMHPDGSSVWINMKVVPIKEKDENKSQYHLCMIEDITERKRAEKDLLFMYYFHSFANSYSSSVSPVCSSKAGWNYVYVPDLGFCL